VGKNKAKIAWQQSKAYYGELTEVTKFTKLYKISEDSKMFICSITCAHISKNYIYVSKSPQELSLVYHVKQMERREGFAKQHFADYMESQWETRRSSESAYICQVTLSM